MFEEGVRRYDIRVEGTLDPCWSERLQGMTIETAHDGPIPVTTLTGRLIDQSALYGVLTTLFELHLPILSAVSAASGSSACECAASLDRFETVAVRKQDARRNI
jgi:hypothetical protein